MNTDLVSHYRRKEEASTKAVGVDLISNRLNSLAIVCGPLQFQHSPISCGKKRKKKKKG